MSELPSASDAFETKLSRYVVGIDLGTTNCAAAFVDTQAKTNELKVRPFPIQQWVDFSSLEQREVLPSFHYELTSEESSAISALAARKTEFVVGTLARDSGARQPGRQIASAKSWLCHDGVDRQSPLLPWHNDPDVTKLSPVEASARYLAHIREAWDQAHPHSVLAEQDVVITLPASFDEVARQLTIEAAKAAGLPRVLLVEEPQAAFYWWLHRNHTTWEQMVSVGQTILVCDIGGGTTDFTLIRVRSAPDERTTSPSTTSSQSETLQARDRGRQSLHRVAVGEHLILGGDNIDLALARLVENGLPAGERLNPRSWDMLRSAARSAKEKLLGTDPPPQYSIALSSGGSRLVAGQTRVELNVTETQQHLLDGFFPAVTIDARPIEHQSGFQEFGLPYASEAAITKHLAAFLWDHRWAGRNDSEQSLTDLQAARPDWVLFNGGVLASAKIRERLLDVLATWFTDTDDSSKAGAHWRPGVLDNDRLDLAVACGAAYFGLVRRGLGVRIEAKLARSYYLVVSQDPPVAMCIIGGDASPGDKNRIAQTPLELAVGEPVQFPIVYSSTRLADRPGELVEITHEQFTHLLPIRTVLQLPRRSRSERLQVVLETELSELGTLQLWCATPDGAQRWQLEFDIRSTTETDRDVVLNTGAELGVVEHSLRDIARSKLTTAFGTQLESPKERAGTAGQVSKKSPDVIKDLVQALELPKHRWPPSLLRGMWQDLMELAEGRKRGPEAEARWLNLLGYCLRPGYGMAADDWRVSQTWRTVFGKLAFATASSRSEALILWRRISGGFTAGQQMAVYQQVAGPLRGVLDPVRRAKGGAGALQPAELIEMLRLVGSLELLPKSEKELLGDWLFAVVDHKRWAPARSALLWTLGRLGNRVPTYGPLNTVVDTQTVERWLEKLIRITERGPAWQLSVMLCARRTGDRYRDIDDSLRQSVVVQLAEAPKHYCTLVESGGQLAQEESSEIVGEALPLGLRTRQ